ncbi:hypothetical protein ABE437_10405 [Isoptericola cucumis]|uniref:hypothetical protein n=1 Tax=Isoptericola cucumis TaxID=1776856 RepID=UPI0032083044
MRRLRLTRSRLPVLATAGVAVVLVAGGCGAAGDGAEPAAEPAPAVSVPADLRMGGDGEASRSADKDKSEDKGQEQAEGETKDDAPAEKGDADAAACAEMQAAWAATNRALVDLSPEHPRALVESFRSGHQAVTSAEPTAEISSAWSAMAGYLGDAVEAFEDVDEDDADAVSTAMAETISADDTERATTAAQEVTDYLAATCTDR